MDSFRLGHRKSLDGVRGLAIVFVLLSHLRNFPLQGGFIGVDLFFVLSGFLITTLLLEEERETGGILLRAFYARRALRLLPPLLVVLAVMVGLSASSGPAEEAARMRTSAAITLFYSANWFLAFRALPSPELGPAWSLSVEEQFYLVWPALLVALSKLNVSKRAIARLAFTGLLLSAAWRALVWGRTGSFERAFYGSDTHSDGLLAGTLVGILVTSATPGPGIVRALNWAGHLTLGCLLLYLHWGWAADASALQAGILLLNLGMASMVACLVFSPGPLLRAVFEFPPLVWLGRISYGVYLWHMVTFGMGDRLPLLRSSGSWVLTLAATVGLAAVSYYALERPLLRRFKPRFERVSAKPVSP